MFPHYGFHQACNALKLRQGLLLFRSALEVCEGLDKRHDRTSTGVRNLRNEDVAVARDDASAILLEPHRSSVSKSNVWWLSYQSVAADRKDYSILKGLGGSRNVM